MFGNAFRRQEPTNEEKKRNGHDRYGNQRWRCMTCGQTWIERAKPRLLGHMRLPLPKAIAVLHHLIEGCSVRSTSRLTGVDKNCILDLLILVGERCRVFFSDRMQAIKVNEVQVDEVWGFVGMKEKTRERLHKGEEFGDAYCFTALERNTKLLLCWHVGKREADEAQWFCDKLALATSGRFQITTDGFKPYCTTVIEALRWRADFAQYIKIFSGGGNAVDRYNPGKITRTAKRVRAGKPDKSKISTSIVERSNLTIRMATRRMTRLTNAFSKLWDNHEAALALFFMVYNFVTIHGTLKTTPAVAHGLTDHPWSIEEMLTELAEYA